MDRQRLWELMRFCFVGGVSLLIDMGLLYILTEYVSIPYLWSSAISFTVSLAINYWLNVTFVFTFAKKPSLKQITLFVGSSVVGLGLNQLCMWLFVEVFGIYSMFSKLLATVIVTVWNYVIKRKAVTA